VILRREREELEKRETLEAEREREAAAAGHPEASEADEEVIPGACHRCHDL
jgi:hypothetical protein